MSGRLEGLGVVITRPRAAAEALAAALEREGARPFVFPALEIEDLPPSPALDAALALLDKAVLAIFVSAHAAEHGLAAVKRRGPWPQRVPVAAVGEATAQALRNSGFARVISPRERHDSESLAALPELQADRVRGHNVVIFRGEGGRERLKQLLEERGARVSYAECYRRVRPGADAAPLLQAWARGEVHAVSVLSGETLANFVAMLGEEGAPRLGSAVLVVPHEAVAAGPDARRFSRVIVAGPGPEGVVKALGQLRVTS
jgi:uroporphyrinogen-III synthase